MRTQNKIFFTADQHFGHKAILRYCNRKFNSITAMDETLIKNWNSVVARDDTVYMLGDFTLRGLASAKGYFSKLEGVIKVVPGSHDKKWLRQLKKDSPIVNKCGKTVEILPPLYSTYVYNRYTNSRVVVVMCHYALRVWDKSHFNSWQLFGHSHGKLRGIGKQHDVGVDNNNYFPVPLQEVCKIMGKAPDNLNFVGRR